jgi:D-alanyl-D-alanine carboxypeptidase (penicillin-binding protein 5/6)
VRSPYLRAVAVALAIVAVPVGVGAAGARPGSFPPPTPVPPDGEPSPFVKVLQTPAPSTQRPDLDAAAAVLADLDTGQVLYAKGPDQERPIASVTKIMTALLVLERANLTDVVTVGEDATFPPDLAGLSALGLVEGERISVENLLYALLLQSANDAAIALADHVSGTEARFEKLMNARAAELGMTHTRFRSPNGLDDRGYSSARDLATLTRATYAASPVFSRITSTEFHEIPAPHGPPRSIQNRNALLWLYPGAFGTKTGYTARAGFCVVAAAQRDGRRLVAVVLGSPGEPFSEAATLLNYGFDAFTQHRFAEAGEAAGTVAMPGGAVSVRTAGGLDALVPTDAIAKATRTVIVDPAAAYPPAPGEQVATLRVATPGLVLGDVPLVAADIPPPPPVEEGGPWWARATRAVAHAAAGALGGAFG